MAKYKTFQIFKRLSRLPQKQKKIKYANVCYPTLCF